MAASDATRVPASGYIHRQYGWIQDTSGELITTGLSTVTAQLSRDGADWVSCTNAPVKCDNGSGGDSGIVYVELTAAENSGYYSTLKFSSNAATAVDYIVATQPASLTPAEIDSTDLELAQTLVYAYFMNALPYDQRTNTARIKDGSGNQVAAFAVDDGNTRMTKAGLV
jgi:hypothetical protein